MSEKEEGSLSHSDNGSIDGSLKGSGSPESGRLTRSRSASPASRKSNVSPASRHSPASPRSRSRSRSRSFRKGLYRSRSRSRSRRRYYHSRSRSRSPYYGGSSSGGHRRRSRYSRSRSRSRSPYYERHSYYSERRRGRYYRSRSRSPMSRRRRHLGSRDNPKEGRCIGVFGLSLYTQERDLREAFNRYGPLEDVQIVYDHQSGRSRGFGFIYFRTVADALEAKDRAGGTEIDGRRIRVDYSITERAHTPTPGIYLGKPTPGYRGYARRSPSPYYNNNRRGGGRYSRSRSRSRSYTPPSRRY